MLATTKMTTIVVLLLFPEPVTKILAKVNKFLKHNVDDIYVMEDKVDIYLMVMMAEEMTVLVMVVMMVMVVLGGQYHSKTYILHISYCN